MAETRSQPPQVYMNFRGAELRQSFIAHLEMALRRSGFNVYVEMLVGGDVNSLFKGIEESKLALVIFSKKYAESAWCLDELVKIKERVEEGKLLAIPIIYNLDPSQVRRLDGDFGTNMWNLVKGTSEFGKVKLWKEALDFFSHGIGLVSDKTSDEAVFIEHIVLRVRGALREDDDLLGELQDSGENSRADSFNISPSATLDELHEVFISFRGRELRHSFVSHLAQALRRSGVCVYVEGDELLSSKDLGHRFMRIDKSMIALVILSSGYIGSSWSLDELVKIKESADEGKVRAIPIFYKVDPSDVRYLKGELADNFQNVCHNKPDRDFAKWIEALKSVAYRSGYNISESSSESEVVSRIVSVVVKFIAEQRAGKLFLSPSTEKGKSTKLAIVGMEQPMEQLEKKLDFGSNDTRIIGVVGMPCIGKTTLAMMLHQKWNRKFICCVPFHDIRKKSEDYGLLWLRKTFLETVLEGKRLEISDETTHGSVKAELLKNKIFAVLDDVSDKKQLEFLLGDLDWIKQGSKIVITTRDKSLLEGFAHDTYVVPGLNDREAFQLLSYHAFHDQIRSPTGKLLTLSRMFVDYARGHPVALKFLGRELSRRNEANWKSKWEQMTNKFDKKFQDLWKLFTDQLNEKQKDVFLDIASFFQSEDEYFLRCLLDSGDPDSTDAVSEVKDLINKFLITIADGRVEVNIPLCAISEDLRPHRWRRLSNYEAIIYEVMKMGKPDANDVRGVFLDMSKLKKSIILDISTFANMRNLRYLKIYDSCCPRQCEADCKLNSPDGLEFHLEEVRYLHWVKFPLEELPSGFRPDNLVDLRLPYSKITRVWDGERNTPRLKWVDLSHSTELLDLSALSKVENLQSLNLEGCTSLDELPEEFRNMKSLVYLNLRGCIGLWSLPKMNLKSLKTLILSDCSNLEEFQLISDSLEFLHLDGTAIQRLPPAIKDLQRLVVLNMKNCKMLKDLPSCLRNLKALEKLILSGCSRLKNLPDVSNSLKHLQILLVDGTGAKEMPSISCFTGSDGPASADTFSEPLASHYGMRGWIHGVNGVSSLRRLCLSGNDFVSLQPNIGKLYSLKWLDVKDCKKLLSVPMLPPRLEYFNAHGCDSLERVANPLAFSVLSDQIHASFNFSNCNKLDQDAKDSIVSYTRWRSQLVLDEHTRYNRGSVLEALTGTSFPGREVPAWFSHRATGSVLNPRLPPHWSVNTFTGIGLCAVIVFNGYHNQRKRAFVKCNCEFKKKDGSNIRFSCTVGGWSEPSSSPREIFSSHVLIGFMSKMDLSKIIEEDDEEKCVSTETAIEFEVTDGMEEIAGCEIVKCGFTLGYAPQEMGNICSV